MKLKTVQTIYDNGKFRLLKLDGDDIIWAEFKTKAGTFSVEFEASGNYGADGISVDLRPAEHPDDSIYVSYIRVNEGKEAAIVGANEVAFSTYLYENPGNEDATYSACITDQHIHDALEKYYK